MEWGAAGERTRRRLLAEDAAAGRVPPVLDGVVGATREALCNLCPARSELGVHFEDGLILLKKIREVRAERGG